MHGCVAGPVDLATPGSACMGGAVRSCRIQRRRIGVAEQGPAQLMILLGRSEDEFIDQLANSAKSPRICYSSRYCLHESQRLSVAVDPGVRILFAPQEGSALGLTKYQQRQARNSILRHACPATRLRIDQHPVISLTKITYPFLPNISSTYPIIEKLSCDRYG